MIRSSCLFVFAFLCVLPAHSEEWKPLFNGKDLDGWTVKIRGHDAGDNFADTFRVEDGLLKVRFDGYEGPVRGRFGHVFHNEPMSHYRLRVEYRVVGEQADGGPKWAYRNSGVMIHGQTPESMRKDQSFPVSLEVQLLSRDEPNANLCTPGTNVVLGGKLHTAHCTSSSSEPCKNEDWVTVEVEVRGGELIRHFVNGKQVMEYSEPQLDERDADAKSLMEAGADKMLTGGTISLQAESHPIDFRRVEVMQLTP
ncbi:MAG: DUF1080 domain-containing protein [Planctomycetota bacterium]